MNKEWSELNKLIQSQRKKRDTYEAGIGTLSSLRDNLWNTIISFKDELSREEFNAIPFINADGYHSKTIDYSLWHIFRI
ncbi:MAG: phage head-tail adapter protein, partial [Lachnospiraceae bacterium]|nr:phage head-tail adapter protein [Lachnospiraceae bacterium]